MKYKDTMHEVLHVIGLCPDHFAHINLIDVIVANYESLTHLNFKLIIKSICQRKYSKPRLL